MTASGTQYPAVAPLRPIDTSDSFGSLEVIVYGSYDDGTPAAFQLSGTDAPNLLLSAPTGTGMTTLLRCLAIGGARIGCDVRICDPKCVEMRGLRGWPGVTRISTRVEEMIALIEAAYEDVHSRYEAIEEGRAREEDYQRILLIVDVYPLVSMLISDHWHQARGGLPGCRSKEQPFVSKLRALVLMAGGAKMNLIVGTPRADAEAFTEDLHDQFGGRIALGRQTAAAALLMFGDASAGRDISLRAPGLGTAATPGGPRRVTVGWLPDPLGHPGPGGGDVGWPWSLLRAMLPDGATWNGPCPANG